MGLNFNSNVFIVLAFLAIAALIQPGTALTCWTCSSVLSKECGDPMNITEHHRAFHTKDCEASASQNSYGYNEKYICKKIVQRENGQLVVRRSCEVPNPDERDISNGPCGPHTATQSHVTIESCHICNTNYCNGATSITGMQLFQATAIAVFTCLLSPTLRSLF